MSWEGEAHNWIRWARSGHDAYWNYSPQFFELIPPAGRATLEIGCGEGRVARDLAGRGHRVTGIDSSPTLLEAARQLQPDADFQLADAARLPFEDAMFDLVVAFNSLMDVDDMPGAVREAARALTPTGRLCVSITHPFQDAGRFERGEAGAPFVVRGSYFGRRRFDETFEHDGLRMRFVGWCYPLEDYARAFEDAGLAIEALREPRVPAEAVAADPSEERWQRMPLFLFLRLRKVA